MKSTEARNPRRISGLVIEVPEKEARRQSTPPTNLQSQTENPRVFTAAPNNPGGK